MQCHAQQTLFICAWIPPAIHLLGDIKDQIGLLDVGLVFKGKNPASLIDCKQAIGVPFGVGKFEDSKRFVRIAILVHHIPALPLQLRKCEGTLGRQHAIHGLRDRAILRQLSHFDVSKRDQISMVLQTDVTFARRTEAGELSELAFCNKVFPFLVP